MEYITLSNDVKIPIVGLGVYRAENGDEAINSIKYALEAGYRHIDTAQRYFNEESVGNAIKDSGVPREEIFITTKVGNPTVRARETTASVEESLEKMGLDYLDLLLIHWPVDGMKEAWLEMEKLYKDGKVRAIGVSNFHQNHLDDLATVATIKPMVNQIESNPQFNNDALIKACKEQGIAMEAYTPLGGLGDSMRTSETLKKIGEKYGKSPVQVIIRWDIQRKVIVLPKSVTKQRIIDNIDVFDFELTSEEMAVINAMNKDIRSGSDPDNFNF
ncbi:MAG: aldo/keto reductase [Clostridia bacterium]